MRSHLQDVWFKDAIRSSHLLLELEQLALRVHCEVHLSAIPTQGHLSALGPHAQNLMHFFHHVHAMYDEHKLRTLEQLC